MNVKELFLSIKTPEEYNDIRKELKGLDWSDKDVRAHCRKIFPQDGDGIDNGYIARCYLDKPKEV